MRLHRSIMDELNPPEPPSAELVSDADLEESGKFESEQLRNSFLWSQALTRLAFAELPVPVDNYLCMSAGFVNVSESLAGGIDDIPYAHGYTFGLNLFVESGERREQTMVRIPYGGRRFAVLTSYGSIEEQGLPNHPPNGTGTCWVKSTSNKNNWQYGILGCRHSLAGLPMNMTYTCAPSRDHTIPVKGSLKDITACTIDASVTEVSQNHWPQSSLTPLQIGSPIPPGQRVHYEGLKTSGTGTVLSVFQHPRYVGIMFGHRFFMDCHGDPGDSGALCRDPDTGHGLGIYMGRVPDQHGGYEGICQTLHQAAAYFRLTTYI